MSNLGQKQVKKTDVSFGQRVQRKEEELRGSNLAALREQDGWKDVCNIMEEQFRDCLEDILNEKDDTVVLAAVTYARAIENFASKIKVAINRGEIATKLLQESMIKSKPCR